MLIMWPLLPRVGTVIAMKVSLSVDVRVGLRYDRRKTPNSQSRDEAG